MKEIKIGAEWRETQVLSSVSVGRLIRRPHKFVTRGCHGWHSQILADQLTLSQPGGNKFIGSTNQPANTNTRKNMSLSPLDTNLKFFHGFLDFHKVHKVLQPNDIFNK